MNVSAFFGTMLFFFSSRRRHTRYIGDWSSDVCSSDLIEDVHKTEAEPVPLHIRNAVTGLMKNISYGKGYKYAHNFDDKVTDMTCLPDNLAGRTYYQPTDQGFEQRLRQRLDEIRKIRSRPSSSL